MEKLEAKRFQKSTAATYYKAWKLFNKFLVLLDKMPSKWEERLTLHVTYLFRIGRKSGTILSYISGIKAMLSTERIYINADSYKLTSLVKACRVENDHLMIRLPIQKPLLGMILDKVRDYFLDRSQLYLCSLFMTIISTGYYGLLRVGELPDGGHAIQADDMHVAKNKNKLQIILRSSKTHARLALPQFVKISSKCEDELLRDSGKGYCPHTLIRNYLKAHEKATELVDKTLDIGNLFIFSDGSPVKPRNLRFVLKKAISKCELDQSSHECHSLRSGREVDLMKMGISVNNIKHIGRWKSNAVYKYIKVGL